MLSGIFISAAFAAVQVLAAPAQRSDGPTVTLDDGTFVGTSSNGVNSWLGIPFAQPPTGNNRFNLPQPNAAYNGTYNATAYGPDCPQQSSNSSSALLGLLSNLPLETVEILEALSSPATNAESEDCLTLNIIAPPNVTPDSKLPVLFWIYGGGFEGGSTTAEDGTAVVNRAITLDEPVIYVSVNYRVSAFGFLAGQEVKDAKVGNLGLQDQRAALRWVQKYISAFGGDPSQVTIWGESAGAISVALQMLTNGGDTEGLFRAAFMESGSPIPMGDITNGQKYYDFLVEQTNCTGSADTLQCLREVDYTTLKTAVDATPGLFSYQSLNLAWTPRSDGNFLADHPQQLVLQGSVASIPFITGDCDDEGTLFGLSSSNVTTDAQFLDYLQNNYLPSAPSDMVAQYATLYPEDPTQGSPFDTGILNTITPQFKRIAAVVGDAVFQGPRRFFIQQRFDKQDTWSFVSKRFKAVPVLGAFHSSDLQNVYKGGEMADYLINFATHLDPNQKNATVPWPKYTNSTPTSLVFQDDPLKPITFENDTYRADAIAYGIELLLNYPI